MQLVNLATYWDICVTEAMVLLILCSQSTTSVFSNFNSLELVISSSRKFGCKDAPRIHLAVNVESSNQPRMAWCLAQHTLKAQNVDLAIYCFSNFYIMDYRSNQQIFSNNQHSQNLSHPKEITNILAGLKAYILRFDTKALLGKHSKRQMQ